MYVFLYISPSDTSPHFELHFTCSEIGIDFTSEDEKVF